MLGFYDTGVGGLQILNKVLKIQKNLPACFLMDSEILPLGEKSHEEIKKRVKDACRYLFESGAEIVILACNTASVNTIREIQSQWLPANFPDKKVLGVTKPLIEYLEFFHDDLKPKKGILLATQSTIRTDFYQKELKNLGFLDILPVIANDLADAIERKDSQNVQELLREYVSENLIDTTKIDYVILACTHYHHAFEQIQNHFLNSKIIDPSEYTAQRIVNYLIRHPEIRITGDQVKILNSKQLPIFT